MLTNEGTIQSYIEAGNVLNTKTGVIEGKNGIVTPQLNNDGSIVINGSGAGL